MAQRVETVLTDDLDGGVADTTVRFAWNGADYEIDLSTAHASELQVSIAPYVEAARKVGAQARAARRSRARGSDGDAPNPSEVREWAKAQGMKVSDRGRVPAELIVRFQAAGA